MSEKKPIRLAWMILVLAACQPAPVVVIPTPQTILLDVSLPTAWIIPAADACARELGGINLAVQETASRSFEPAKMDLLILSGSIETDTASTFEIGEMQAAVIVHPDNALQELTVQNAGDLFAGRVRQWAQIDPRLPAADVQVWLPLPEDELWSALSEFVLKGGEPSRLARIAPDPVAMRSAVAADENAVGFLPAAYLDSSVRQVSSALDIRLPVVAVSRSQPEGAIRDFLICLQGKITP